MLTTDAPIIVSETYPVKVQTVWSALTELYKLREWFFEDIPEYKAEVGFETTFDIQATSHLFPHHWTVTEVIENKRLATKWDFTGFEGQSLVTFDLEDLEGSTKLTVKS